MRVGYTRVREGSQATAQQADDAVSVQLGTLLRRPEVRLDGFKARELRQVRAQVKTNHHLYTVEWRLIEIMDSVEGGLLALGDARLLGCEHPSSRKSQKALIAKCWMVARAYVAIVVTVATQRGSFSAMPLFALEAALALAQMQATSMLALNVCVLTASDPANGGSWGLSRSARAEAAMLHTCMTAPISMVFALAIDPIEPEAVLNERYSYAPRLEEATRFPDSVLRLHFHSRGAIRNLFIEPLSPVSALGHSEVLIHVRAVGLNFRDVLNVLGEYPGDPGPPGGDVAGVVGVESATPYSALGVSHAPLASIAIASASLLTQKPSALSFEQACTLPVAWSTMHTATERARLHAGSSILVQAAAGGVGLKAVEYAHWLHASPLGTAGRPHKHALLRTTGVNALCSSRDGAIPAVGTTRQLNAHRLHAVLNSLSLDFITVSFALLSEGGAFEEIGKRGIWAPHRHQASASTTAYYAIALDADMALAPTWMYEVLRLLSARAGVGTATSLPLRSFDMGAQHERAFRTLQSGLNTGKIVVRLMARKETCDGVHAVTGGTGGLGLLTGRWLAQRGARSLVLASRNETLAKTAGAEWEGVEATWVTATFERCDSSEVVHVVRLMGLALLSGLWHAAGVLTDGLLPKQAVPDLVHVFAPKAYGAWGLHASSAAMSMVAFALFSSVSGLLGNAAQANYAAANACLDALATCRHAQAISATSTQWGPWAQVGMAARGVASERMAAMEEAKGFARISLAWGLAVLNIALNASSPVLGVMPVMWSRFLGMETPALLSAFASKASKQADQVGLPLAAMHEVSLDAVLEMVGRTSPAVSPDSKAGGAMNADFPLMEAGVDSLSAVELRNQLQSAAGGRWLPSTLVFEHPTARQLASILQAEPPVSAAATLSASTLISMRAAVSIDGLSALLPSHASSPQSARYSMTVGHNAVAQVPAVRWDVRAQPIPPEPIASRMRHAAFVRNAEYVDHPFFAVSTAEAAAIDPCQRLVLEVGYAALWHASLKRALLSGSLTGIFLAFAATDFSQILRTSPAGGSVYAATGSSASIAAGRLSFALGLHGPCVSYDTACSAALVASHAGMRALQLAECTVGLAVGVTLMLAPAVSMSFAIAGMTSACGRSRTFDGHADGYARGEACGAVTLRNHDGALGLLGSAVRQDGRSASLTAPNGQAQQGLLVAALQDASTDADSLVLNEAHGTGTSLGDPIEAGSLMRAALAARKSPLPVGGVKANLGHAEPAAGATGLLKLALGLRVGEASLNAQLRSLNPHVGHSVHGAKCALPKQLAKVAFGSGGVSSFGYAGTITHTVLSVARGEVALPTLSSPLIYRRFAFPWQVAVPDGKGSARASASSPSSHDADLCIIGAGAIGLIVARDAASSGISSVLLEREGVIGGVWAKNEYPGLRLQVTGASYRCFSVAPAWTREGGCKNDVYYRPTGREVLAYFHELAAHELLSIRTSASYTQHMGSGGSFTISTSQGNVCVRALVFAPGAHETTAGSPHWPIDATSVTNGACVLHSSRLNACRGWFYSATRKFVVGASKAAIDVLDTLEPADGCVIWAHRGHIIFHNRDRYHASLMEGKETQSNVIDQAHMGSLYLKNQEFGAAFDGMLRSGAGICVGYPLAAQPAMRGGAECEASLAYARQFLPRQLLISSLRCDHGVLQICCDDGRILSVGTDDAAALCTGQRAKDAGEGSYARRADCNHDGLFHVAPFSNQTPTNALYMLHCVVTYLAGTPSAYNDGRVAAAFARQAELMETIKDRGAWARFWANMGGVQYDVVPLIFDPGKYKAPGLEAHHRWVGEWYGKSVQVEHAFALLATETSRTLSSPNDTGDRVSNLHTGMDVQGEASACESLLLDKVLDALRAVIPDRGDVDDMADLRLSSAGLDSLGAIELRALIQEVAGGAELPVTFVFDYPTPRAIVALVMSKATAMTSPVMLEYPTRRPVSKSTVGWVQSARLVSVLSDDTFSTVWYSIGMTWLEASHMYDGHTSLQTSYVHDPTSRRWRWRVKLGSQLPQFDSRSERLVFTDRGTPAFYDVASELLWLNHTVWDGVSLVLAAAGRPTQHLSVYDEHVSHMHADWEEGGALVDQVLRGPALFDASPTFCFERRRDRLPADVFQKIARYAHRTTIPLEIAWYAVLMVLALECTCMSSAALWIQDPNRHTTNADVFGYVTSEVGYIAKADMDAPFEQRVQRCVKMMMDASAEYRCVFPEILATHTCTGEFFERSLGLNYIGHGDGMDSTDRRVIAASLAAEVDGMDEDGELAFFGKMNWMEVGDESNPLVQLSGRADAVDFMANKLLPALCRISLDKYPKAITLAREEIAMHTPDYLRSATRRAQEALDNILVAAVPPTSLTAPTEFAIVGGGLAGLTIAATVSVASVSYAVFEQTHSVGGQWRSNAK